MRVLHIYHAVWPTRGGIEDYLTDLTRAQAAQGLEPIILCANDRPITLIEFSPLSLLGRGETWIQRRGEGQARVIRAASFGRFYTPFCPSWPLWIRRLQPVLVHLHLPCPLGEWAVWLARPRALLVSLHNDYVRPRAALKFHRPLHRAVLKRADAIIVAAPDYARTSPVLHDLQPKVRIVPYGVDLERIAHRASPMAYGVSHIAPHVLSAGRLCYYKGIEVLLDAAPAIEGHITIIGDGPWRARLHAQARRHRLDGRVRFRGAVSEQALIAQMQSSAVFVFPSTERSEAFGLAQLKAMACGLPVVSSDLPGVRWLNRHGETGLVVPVRDAQALACAINRLLSDTVMRQRLSIGAQTRSQQFTLTRMLDETNAVYHQVVNG